MTRETCSNPEELKSPRADLVRRMFWHCIMTETYDLPPPLSDNTLPGPADNLEI